MCFFSEYTILEWIKLENFIIELKRIWYFYCKHTYLICYTFSLRTYIANILTYSSYMLHIFIVPLHPRILGLLKLIPEYLKGVRENVTKFYENQSCSTKEQSVSRSCDLTLESMGKLQSNVISTHPRTFITFKPIKEPIRDYVWQLDQVPSRSDE